MNVYLFEIMKLHTLKDYKGVYRLHTQRKGKRRVRGWVQGGGRRVVGRDRRVERNEGEG